METTNNNFDKSYSFLEREIHKYDKYKFLENPKKAFLNYSFDNIKKSLFKLPYVFIIPFPLIILFVLLYTRPKFITIVNNDKKRKINTKKLFVFTIIFSVLFSAIIMILYKRFFKR